MFKGHFLVAQMRGAFHRPEATNPFVFLNLVRWGLHLAPVRLELAPVLDVLDDGRGKERDGLVHLGSAQGAVRLWSLITACTDKMAIGAAVHCTMRLSFSKNGIRDSNQIFYHGSHFLAIQLFQTKFGGKCHFHFLFF